ncbi:hypothetical protein CIB48_g5437 [Xylaria polymorpha]|nr:hypothetical protein CIB48_g5437 [Xylaria polymorpha]
MSADDQQFWDLLSSVPNHVRQYSGDVAVYIDKAVDKAADHVRDALASTPWIPEYARPNVPSPLPAPVMQLSTWESVRNWAIRHRVSGSLFICVVGYVAYRTVRYSRLVRKSRRARRARNGSRLEVVVIAGSPSLPLTKSLSLDLERRGFLVYVVCSTLEDEAMVQSLSRPDIRGLSIDITDPPSAGASLERFAAFLQTPHAAVPRAKPSYLTLASVILIPSLHYQTSPIATIPPSNFAQLFNTHLLQPILTIQAFLPLLTSRLTPHPPPASPGSGEKPPAPSTPKVLVFTPSIISSINPPSTRPRLPRSGSPVTHLQLGTFDFTGFVPARGPHAPGVAAAFGRDAAVARGRALAYARNYESQSASAISAGRVRGLRGSALRDLHHAVFDVLDGSEGGDVVRVGLGAGLYGFVGRWAPRSLVAWMMGIRRVDELSTWEGSYSNGTSASGSGSASGSDGEKSGSEGGGEYIAVGRDYEGGAK